MIYFDLLWLLASQTVESCKHGMLSWRWQMEDAETFDRSNVIWKHQSGSLVMLAGIPATTCGE